MKVHQKIRCLRAAAAISVCLWAGSFSTITTAAQERGSHADGSKASSGKRIFTANCAGCHGLDGRGGERAPSIAGSAKLRRAPDGQIANIISNGVTGTGMPAFHSFSPTQVAAVVAYVRALQGELATAKLPGNPGRGKEIFFGKGECSTCHTISGEGGYLGPDLSAYGSAIPAKAILDAILNRTRIVPPGYRLAVVTTGDGTRIEGMIRNEDNFSLQLETTDGSFHFIQKSDLQKLEYSGKSLMPTNYGDQLTNSELNDLASYLMSAGSSPKAAPHSKQNRGSRP